MRYSCKVLFIARDKNGSLWAYVVRPFRASATWDVNDEIKIKLNPALFPNLEWSDDYMEIDFEKLLSERVIWNERSNRSSEEIADGYRLD